MSKLEERQSTEMAEMKWKENAKKWLREYVLDNGKPGNSNSVDKRTQLQVELTWVWDIDADKK